MCTDLENVVSVEKHAVQPARVKQNMEKNGKLEKKEKLEQMGKVSREKKSLVHFKNLKFFKL